MKSNLYNKVYGNITSSILLLAFAAACSTEQDATLDLTDGGIPQPITIIANASGNTPSTRLAYEDQTAGGVLVTWSAGDAFKVYGATDAALFTLSGGEGTTQGNFTGTAPTSGAPDGGYSLLYPAQRTTGATWAEATATVLGQVQTGNGMQSAHLAHLAAYNYMRATSVSDLETVPVTFVHLMAMMRFDLTLDGYDATTDGAPVLLTLTSDTGKPFFESIQASTGAGDPNSQSTSLSLSLKDATPADGGTLRAYLMMVPATLPAGSKLTVSLITEKGTRYQKEQSIENATTYAAAQRYKAEGFTLAKLTTEGISTFDNSTNAATDFGGTGDGLGYNADNPYLIENAKQLKKLVTVINSSSTSSTYTGRYFKLMTDIHVTADTWASIGNNSTFKGHFDGNGHIISGELKGSSEDFGFFGAIDRGSVHNLYVTANVTNNYSSGYSETGSIAGYCTISTISGCINSGKVVSANVSSGIQNSTGGIVGYVSSSTITGCINRGEITGGGTQATSSHNDVGGIVGYDYNSNLSNCQNYGTVQTANSNPVMSYTGGIIGYICLQSSDISLRDCWNYGAVKGGTNASSKSYTGGVTGYIDTSYSGGYTCIMHTCHNRASVTAGSVTSGTNAKTGGLIGYIYNTSTIQTKIYDCCTDSGSRQSTAIGGAQKTADETLKTCTENHPQP